ncbi:MAG: CBS domain-containing protein, partial [Verrucomicrobia bacterium]|nr:CBS domain-containing protein [Verrucomicrobiota bacterium]
NLIRFQHIEVDDIMTPRTVVKRLPETQTCQEAVKTEGMLRFSRIPVYAESEENITGYVLKQEVLEELAFDKHDTPLSQLRRPIRLVSETDSLSSLFDTLLSNREHIALVVDEYGGMAGVVTNEDLIETLLGLEILDEFDETENMRDLARKKWKERAQRMNLDIQNGND